MIKIRSGNPVSFRDDCDVYAYFKVDPHEVLKTLEEQAPEVLAKYKAYYEISAVYYKDSLLELTWDEIGTGKHASLEIELSPERAEKILEVVPPYFYHNANIKSPWIPVSEQEPPRDRGEFFARYKTITWVSKYKRKEWLDYAKEYVEKIPFDEWMPVPK